MSAIDNRATPIVNPSKFSNISINHDGRGVDNVITLFTNQYEPWIIGSAAHRYFCFFNTTFPNATYDNVESLQKRHIKVNNLQGKASPSTTLKLTITISYQGHNPWHKICNTEIEKKLNKETNHVCI